MNVSDLIDRLMDMYVICLGWELFLYSTYLYQKSGRHRREGESLVKKRCFDNIMRVTKSHTVEGYVKD